MYQNLNSANSKLDKVMSDDQFNQIVEAIISGKYSWACLLILRFSGYNPLHYIPYRTYNRLMKMNREQNSQPAKAMSNSDNKSDLATASPKPSNRLRDLCCLEEMDRQSQQVKGGMGVLSQHTMPNLIWHKFRDL
ncbi:MAG: HetP family heterocyst commitment protein [Cyanobacteria bacterium P01_G01_bin.39]